MDIEKTLKFILFAGLSVFPPVLALIFFDYSCLYKIKLFADFGKNALIGLVLVYSGLCLLLRLLFTNIFNIYKDKEIRRLFKRMNFMTLFYYACIDVFITCLIPILITYLRNGNYIHFIQNTILIWSITTILWIIFHFFMIKETNK